MDNEEVKKGAGAREIRGGGRGGGGDNSRGRKRREVRGGAPNMSRQLFQAQVAKHDSTKTSKPPYVGPNEGRRIGAGSVLMCSEAAAALLGCCWPQTVSTPKKITLSLYSPFSFSLSLSNSVYFYCSH